MVRLTQICQTETSLPHSMRLVIYQDIDFLVENGLFVNGEKVATENYVDNADAILQAQITTNTADIAPMHVVLPVTVETSSQTLVVLPWLLRYRHYSVAWYDTSSRLKRSSLRR